MTNEFILQLLTGLLCFLYIFFALFLVFVESKNKIGNRTLALFLFVRALDASVLIYGNYISLHPALDVLRHDLGGFLQSPLLFLFVLSVIYRDFKLKAKYLLLLIPFVLTTIVSIPRYYLEYLGFSNSLFDGLPLGFEITFTYTLAIIQNLGLIVLTFVILNRYKKLIFENYSITDNYNHRWLFQMNCISSFLFVVVLVKNIHKFQENPNYIIELRILVMFTILIFICWLVIKALLAPKLFRGVDSNLQLINNSDAIKMLAETEQKKRILSQVEKLKAYMVESEPYLNPELTISKLSHTLEINVSELSLLINHHLSKNFHTFINQYRIDKAQELLKDSSNELTIQQVLYKVGFNSKSSFNVSFKQQTGLTPTQFRNKHK